MKSTYPSAALTTPEPLAKRVIWIVSAVVFLAVVVLNRVQVPAPEGFDVHVFAKANAVINSLVSLLLLAGLFTAKAGRWDVHRKVMLSAMLLSVLFLVSYILHHLFAGETKCITSSCSPTSCSPPPHCLSSCSRPSVRSRPTFRPTGDWHDACGRCGST